MSAKLLLINKSDFFGSYLYSEIEDYIFNYGYFYFGSSLPDIKITEFFGDREEALNDFLQFEPEIERLYYDLEKGIIRTLVISFYNLDGKIQYGKVAFIPSENKYELIYIHGDLRKIDTSENDSRLLNAVTTNKIIKYVINERLGEITSLRSNIFFSYEEGSYHVDESKFSSELKEIFCIIFAEKLNAIRTSDIKLNKISVNLKDLDNPFLDKVEFSYNETKYEYVILTNEIINLSNFDYGDTKNSYIDIFFEVASKEFIDKNIFVIKENIAKENKQAVEKFLSSLYKDLSLIKYDDDSYGFEELGKSSFVTLKDNFIELKTSRNTEVNETVCFKYENFADNKNSIKKLIDKYIVSKPKEYEDYLKDAADFLNNSYDLETTKNKGSVLIEKATLLPVRDTKNKTFINLLKEINEKYEKLLNLDKEKIARVIDLINKIKDVASYIKYSDDLFDAIDELGEGELAAVKNEYDTFLELFSDFSEYKSNQTTFRRVFIRKSALDHLKRINIEQKDLKVLKIVDEIVDQLKCLPGNQLGKYLLSKGLNFPIKADRSIKKIRIMRNAKYRLIFVYGSDLDIDDRLNNMDSIYIFAVTEHKKDKSELYRVAESKPTKYEINDFIIYPKNKGVKIPECTTEQYKIATSFEERPVITFGCAGSGKTTVSIEQYVNIVYTQFNCVSPSSEELVYITFHKGLSDKVKKDLAEFKIEGNTYKLDEYFSYVIGEPYDQTKVVNEVKFINWFDDNYSEAEIKKNKGKKKVKIAPLLEKPDVARLLYTYYRGVFKGSKELLNTKNNYLSLETFLLEMSGETYLSNTEKNAIYQICKEFDEFALKNGYLSDNDYALKVIRQAAYQIKRTNCIIIDEVQDLTEIEIIATITTLNKDSTRIYFYGDPHQSINPNVFDSNTINKTYTALGKITSSESAPLTITYRTNKHLISYLNQLLKHRDKWIGLTKGGLSEIIQPPKTEEDTSWAGYVTNKSLYKRIFESNPNSIIITPSESVKRRLLEKYKEIEPARVITIYDAKGMEWDTIIMYNMFTDYENYFLDMISENGKAKKSTIHRMTFNKFYVGCTRSTKSFVIIEENESIFDTDHPIFKTLLSSFAPIYKKEQVDTYILEDNTFDAWYKEALQNLDNENTATFDHALMHARRLAKTEEDNKLIKDLIEGDPETLERYGFKYLAEGEYFLARSAFVKCNKSTKKHGPYILLATIMGEKNISDNHMKEFLKCSEVIDKYPEVLPKLMKQQAFKTRLKKIQNKLFLKEEK